MAAHAYGAACAMPLRLFITGVTCSLGTRNGVGFNSSRVSEVAIIPRSRRVATPLRRRNTPYP
eukprot:CAMPEP_0197604192 /NCGR_PEP_ID=MMETSP1326-20131121/40725_1 /TAXON_ID=1155430 /ORGANISM="Genus nov. species nov., Strain RCC2288" /LENGTH=62 /DNA_ID=CAMNT_0043171825 /DNA_START=20 /DNA_END=204 /DNA_ORIENTATION=-